MSFSEATRAAVVARAGHRCEYCHLPTRGQVGTFPIDHVTPRSLAGATVLDNLALACPLEIAEKSESVHFSSLLCPQNEPAPIFPFRENDIYERML
jgi:HNH endonuclease